MNIFKSILSPLAPTTNSLHDTLKLVVIGGGVETARRVSVSAWNGFVDSFFLTAHFTQYDYPYDWVLHWLAKQPAWGASREFEFTTRPAIRNGMSQNNSGDIEEEEEEEEKLVHGRRKRQVALMPSLDTTHTIFYRGHWLRITRTENQPHRSGAAIKISVVARNNDILKKLVLEAKRTYEKDSEDRVHIFIADTSSSSPSWRWSGYRAKRSMSSIVLQPGVKDMIIADCKDFLCSEDWYAERGIPFRRGYLLHGVPGSGKTSLIHSLAGELGLDIYVVSLSSKGMSDNMLSSLMGTIPSRCIFLLEDLDAAFTCGISRDNSATGAPPIKAEKEKEKEKEKGKGKGKGKDNGSTLTLSGLLNSLDGVAAAEGRLLFATTNHLDRLDPALSRPGRMDVWINFTHATKWQAEGIFKRFFPTTPISPTQTEESPTSTLTASQSSPNASQRNNHGSKRTKTALNIPQLTEEEISDLAKKFADAIPEDEFSVASLQGYLLKNKARPREAVEELGDWVIKEIETKEKLKKEKTERDAKEKKEKEKLEAEEKEKKEKEKLVAEEKERKEKLEAEEKETKEKEEKKTSEKSPVSTESQGPKVINTAVAVESSPSVSTDSES